MNENEIDELTKRAGQGDAKAQFELGCRYYDGTDGKQDAAEAAKWFRLSAEQDNADAQYELGECFYYGCGVKRDWAEAVRWFGKAAVRGHEKARKALLKHDRAVRDMELVEKGLRLFEGRGVPRSIPEAVKCFCEAANDGNVRAVIKVIDLDETGDAEVREAIMQYADDTLKQRLEYFRKQKIEDGMSNG